MTSAYVFLRHLEHRLQLRQGQQTHRLPGNPVELNILRRSMVRLLMGEDRSADILEAVRRRMAAVTEIYNRIIYHQQARKDQEAADREFQLRSRVELSGTDQSNQQILERLASDVPRLHEVAGRSDLGPQTRRNLYRFLSSAFTSSERYAAVVRHPEAVSRALVLFDTSDYLTDILIRHPEEIATLAEQGETPSRVASGYLFDGPGGAGPAWGDPVFAYLATSSAAYGEKLSLLRQHYRHRTFAGGAKDITELRDVHESLASATAAAEGAILAAFGIAEHPDGLAVMALGRLGTGEFDLLSDADVLFGCEETHDRAALTKAAEQMMNALAAYTREGMVFPVDPRLRPRGGEGELLVTPKQLEVYFAQEAQAWEALMYTKLRFLVGSRRVGERTSAAVRTLFQRFAADSNFLPAIREMRTRLESAEKSFKTSPGGAYDIDFIASYLLIKHGLPETSGSLRDRLWRCADAGILDKTEAGRLDHAAELLRTVEHVVRLVVGRTRKWLPGTEHARQVTAELTAKILRREFAEGLEAELQHDMQKVREIYQRVLD